MMCVKFGTIATANKDLARGVRDLWITLYFEDTYINSQFRIPMWNCFHRDMDSRSNNRLESFNRVMNTTVCVTHPNFWKFVCHVKDFSEESGISRRAGDQGIFPPPRKKAMGKICKKIMQG